MLRSHWTPKEFEETATTYADLIRQGEITWSAAVNEMRSEFGISLHYAISVGVVKMFQRAACYDSSSD